MSRMDVSNNKCEICNLPATAGIIQDADTIRYTCEDHYMRLYEKIANDSKRQQRE
jgi:hypothetical protein